MIQDLEEKTEISPDEKFEATIMPQRFGNKTKYFLYVENKELSLIHQALKFATAGFYTGPSKSEKIVEIDADKPINFDIYFEEDEVKVAYEIDKEIKTFSLSLPR